MTVHVIQFSLSILLFAKGTIYVTGQSADQSRVPTTSPTNIVTTDVSSSQPSLRISTTPSLSVPTIVPTNEVSSFPPVGITGLYGQPSQLLPTYSSTSSPQSSMQPSDLPTVTPTNAIVLSTSSPQPSPQPSVYFIAKPSYPPTQVPTIGSTITMPLFATTAQPTTYSTVNPVKSSELPTNVPTTIDASSSQPSMFFTSTPIERSHLKTTIPTSVLKSTTSSPSKSPSKVPSKVPSKTPSKTPITPGPSNQPTNHPFMNSPSYYPTIKSTARILAATVKSTATPTIKSTSLPSTSLPTLSIGEPSSLAGITAYHNTVRANVSPPAATPIPPLVWDDSLASYAQAWASNCVWGHGNHPNQGQNAYAAQGFVPTGQSTLNAWANEGQYYDYATNTCNAPTGKTCGHYTQVVWAASTHLGCGYQMCTTGTPFSGSNPKWYFVVCNYYFAGNFDGARPY